MEVKAKYTVELDGIEVAALIKMLGSVTGSMTQNAGLTTKEDQAIKQMYHTLNSTGAVSDD